MSSRLILIGFFLWPVPSTRARRRKPLSSVQEIDDVLVNPGMGIETFQRFNGDAINAGLRWSEEGP